MKIAIITAVWQRPEVFALFAKGIEVLQAGTSHEIRVFVSGSEGEVSRKMVEDCGFSYVEIANDPLALKVNASALLSKHYNPDYVLCVGSDDIITPGLLAAYERYMRSKVDYIGVTDFYFWDMKSDRAIYWGGYRESFRRGHTAGPGRMISRRLMDIWKWQPWDVKYNKVLDTAIQKKLEATPHSAKIFSMKEAGVFALDIKTATNMTPFNLWDNTVTIHEDIIHKEFPYLPRPPKEVFNYENKCRRCGELSQYSMEVVYSPEFFKKIEDSVRNPDQYFCKTCQKYTVHDIVSHTKRK